MIVPQESNLKEYYPEEWHCVNKNGKKYREHIKICPNLQS